MDEIESILQALFDQLQGAAYAPRDGSVVTVKRNEPVTVSIPNGGLVILHDGDPGEPETTLGGFSSQYYSHRATVEIYAQHAEQRQRDQTFARLTQWVADALNGNPTLDGKILGISFGAPSSDLERIEGGAAIKSGEMIITMEYEITL